MKEKFDEREVFFDEREVCEINRRKLQYMS